MMFKTEEEEARNMARHVRLFMAVRKILGLPEMKMEVAHMVVAHIHATVDKSPEGKVNPLDLVDWDSVAPNHGVPE